MPLQLSSNPFAVACLLTRLVFACTLQQLVLFLCCCRCSFFWCGVFHVCIKQCLLAVCM